ncbi:MAG TPA: UDP-N-acetylmuramate--L-alanine ligase [Sedimentisphaerales bacterium]|nr:UDP-N-acetylmuramate--L-alanine ligase [Sedimentisphaerales bacterium]
MEICRVKTALGQPTADAGQTLNVAGAKFHFIGAGGIGMSGLAKVLIRNHAVVTGSDQEETAVTDMLIEMGAGLRIGHHPDNLDPDTDAVVISAAVKEDNPELKAARERGCKIYKYAQMLGELMNRYDGIAVAGTHGKSTTSGWLAYCLKEAGLDPNFIIGADVTQLGSSSGVGNGRHFVVEACEYDRSFLNLKPQIAAILNIEQDHLDYYRDEREIVEAFTEFALGLKPGGVLIANGRDPNVAAVIERLSRDCRCETFGLDDDCDFSAQNLRLNNGSYSFDVYRYAELLGAVQIALPGEHNVLNALAVVAMAVNAGVDARDVLRFLPGFTGVDRRLMLKGKFAGITVLDDYAHHPTEIRASLSAIRQRYEPKRIWCIFQPHQYSRTRFLLDDFARSFALADVAIVPEIYFVRDSQAAKKEVNARMLVERINSNGAQALFIDGFARICDYLKENVQPGDLVVTMGAGDIWKVSDAYLHWLREHC